MKVIIDISEEDYKEVLKDTDSGTPFENKVFTAIANGTPIPDNATNGDVIRTIFDPETSLNIGLHCTYFWWNSPYQKGGVE